MSIDPRRQVVEIGRLMYERFLTNSAGGNVSHRVDGYIYMSPRYAGSKYQWNLQPEQVVVLDSQHRMIAGEGMLSRESAMHLAIYDAFPEVNGVIHAHPKYANVFAALGQPIVPTNGYTEKFGQIPVIRPVPAHSPELAEAVVAALASRRSALSQHGLGLILAWHGVVTVGRDLNDAFDVLERIEWSAHTMLMASLLSRMEMPTFISAKADSD
ncbi:MAG: class II aldolase/adducin family protein [Anaerolineae bacterium]|nr:class II aldolase/adducin family protein [Anaerolineae bacterium]MDW8098550.1 class II aldolase/adducin family protein [Anaerolineae bacterium]